MILWIFVVGVICHSSWLVFLLISSHKREKDLLNLVNSLELSERERVRILKGYILERIKRETNLYNLNITEEEDSDKCLHLLVKNQNPNSIYTKELVLIITWGTLGGDMITLLDDNRPILQNQSFLFCNRKMFGEIVSKCVQMTQGIKVATV